MTPISYKVHDTTDTMEENEFNEVVVDGIRNRFRSAGIDDRECKEDDLTFELSEAQLQRN